MKTKSKAAMNTVLYVPNTPDGKMLLQGIKEHLNAGWRMIKRGRNENRKKFVSDRRSHLGLRQSLPASCSSYFAVYFKSNALDASIRKGWIAERAESHKYVEGLMRRQDQERKLFESQKDLMFGKVRTLMFIVNKRAAEAEDLALQLANAQARIADLTTPSWRAVWHMIKQLLGVERAA